MYSKDENCTYKGECSFKIDEKKSLSSARNQEEFDLIKKNTKKWYQK